ncbi:MAG TPA: hypothetical protein ACFYD4_11995 [Candidatus Wunengus sp. YC61]|uniref:hypothetical protein n=1 Tax=Candidatus Wunengus sp. YC61 TaxID=3367698 RepID=UPI004027D797
MFGSQILEVAMGLVLVYSILSLICSAVNEWIASRLGMRAEYLEKAIINIFNDPEKKGKAKEFYDHPLIKGLMDGEKLPSYIPSSTFALALLDVVAPSDTAAGIKTFADVKDTISKLPVCEIRSVLLSFFSTAQENLANVRKDIESWFDGAMQRVSGWYKRKTQWIILGISFLVSGFLNVDSFMIANTLLRDDALRALVVASAQMAVKNTQSDPNAAVGNNPPSGQNAMAKNNIGELHAELQNLNLPIGWARKHDKLKWSSKQKPLPDDPRAVPDDIMGWVYKVIGIVFTALAISQGAPFWFDLLNKFVNLRGAGVKPKEEKEKKDKKP